MKNPFAFFNTKTACFGLCLLTLSACTWVNKHQAADRVVITVADAVTECQSKGTAQVSVLDKLLFIPRRKDKVTSELQTLARNEAVKLGANTVVPEGPPVEGKQSYLAYQCDK